MISALKKCGCVQPDICILSLMVPNRKRGRQGCILPPCLFNLYVEYIMRNTGLEEKLESRLPGEIAITSDMQMTPPLWQKVKRTKKPLDEGERGE